MTPCVCLLFIDDSILLGIKILKFRGLLNIHLWRTIKDINWKICLCLFLHLFATLLIVRLISGKTIKSLIQVVRRQVSVGGTLGHAVMLIRINATVCPTEFFTSLDGIPFRVILAGCWGRCWFLPESPGRNSAIYYDHQETCKE